MAYETGTATDQADLWGKFITFITTNEDLVTASQAWTTAWSAPDGAPNESDVVLLGPGLSEQDNIYIGLRRVERPTPDEYEIQLVGMTGVLDSATEFTGHINVTPNVCRMFTDSGPMTYWFVANGRRFTVVIKISTIFEAMYGGLFLPYADPISYSYPLFIGGSAGEVTGSTAGATSWRSTDLNHRHFVSPHYDTASALGRSPSAWMLSPQGEWLTCGVTGVDTNIAVGPTRFFTSGESFGVVETTVTASRSIFGYDTIRQRFQATFSGDLLLTPFTLVQAIPSNQTYGILDGCLHVPGFNNAAENIVTVDDVDHLTVQDVFRTTRGDYWALALE